MTTRFKEPFKIATTVALVSIAILLFSGSMTAQTFNYSIMHSFTGAYEGVSPSSPLLLDNKGRLYGTTNLGGVYNLGVVYEISATGAERPIHSFTGESDGMKPGAGLISDAAGNLYGVTPEGKGNLGGVFKVDSNHAFSVLHDFSNDGKEGYYAYDNLVADKAGNLYGGCYEGGEFGWGTIFKLDPLGNMTVLHSFGFSDGAVPSNLILDKAGNLYGTSMNGGVYLNGTVFKVDQAGNESVLFSFRGGLDGGRPIGPLAKDQAGYIYGVNSQGGDPLYNAGTLFRMNLQSHTYDVLHTFTGTNGAPNRGLVIDSAGNMYGTTCCGGGSSGGGVVFMLDTNGVYSILHEFSGTPDGLTPSAGLIIDRAGNLYGTTEKGGAHNQGTVFKLARQ